MGAPVMYFEINARDAGKAKEFYRALFGWDIKDMPEMNYGMIDTGVTMGVNGGVNQAQENAPAGTSIYVQVEDPQSYIDKATTLGGSVVIPLTEIPNVVTFAVLRDSDGNVFGLMKGPQTPPAPKRPKAAKPAKKAKAKAKAKAKKAAPKRKKARRK